MGGGGSKPEYHPPQDTLFISVACVGLTRGEYSTDERLSKAPFYSVYFTAKTYIDALAKVLDTVRQTSAKYAAAATPPVQSQQIPGPVYLFNSIDKQTQIIQCYMYFPNISKTTMQKWYNYAEAGRNYDWIHRLLYHNLYSLPADSSCKRFTKDDYGMRFGCSTETRDDCMQDSRVHKRMKIYSDKKKSFEYPSVYFRANLINSADPRVSQYIDSAELAMNVLGGNDIPATDDLTSPQLLSPSHTAKLIITDTAFVIFHGSRVVFSRAIRGKYQTRAVIEAEYFNIYSASGPSASEEQVYALKITSEKTPQPIALLLDDDGSLSIMDADNKKSLVIGADGNLAPGCVEFGADPNDPLAMVNANLIAAANADASANAHARDEDLYDDVADIQMRQRLTNIRAQIAESK